MEQLAPLLGGEVPVPFAALLSDVEAFDAGAFGISPVEAALMDPQQRLLLQCAAESLLAARAGLQAAAPSSVLATDSSDSRCAISSNKIEALCRHLWLILILTASTC